MNSEVIDDRISVPPLYSPFEPAIHPAHATINRRTGEWAQRFGIGSAELRRALVSHDIGTFAARILPGADERKVQIIGDFVLWLFGVDDGYCEQGRPGELAGELSRLLHAAQDPAGAGQGPDPLTEGLRDLRRRLAESASPSQLCRWVDSLREYCLAVVWESHLRSTEAVPCLADYTLMRLHTGAVLVIPPMLEICQGIELDANERDAPQVRAVVEMAGFVIAWDNDILSFHKESRDPQHWLNAVRVLQHERRVPVREALRLCVAHRDRVTSLYLRRRQALAANGSPALRTYLDALDSYVRAAQDWQITSSRYTCPDDPALLPGTFTRTPSDSGEEPLEIPAISWWWRISSPDS